MDNQGHIGVGGDMGRRIEIPIALGVLITFLKIGSP